MTKNYLTETERATLKHIFKLRNQTINKFESLNLDDDARRFIIFEMMLRSKDKDSVQKREELKKKNEKDWIKSTLVALIVVMICVFLGRAVELLLNW